MKTSPILVAPQMPSAIMLSGGAMILPTPTGPNARLDRSCIRLSLGMDANQKRGVFVIVSLDCNPSVQGFVRMDDRDWRANLHSSVHEALFRGLSTWK